MNMFNVYYAAFIYWCYDFVVHFFLSGASFYL